MADILLTHSYFLRFDPKQWKAQQPFPPLANLYAAAVLRSAHIDLDFQDMMFAESASEIKKSIEKLQPKYFIIYDDGFNYLTKMCLTNMREAAFEMIAIAKKNGCTVIISSSDATDNSEEYLKKGADFIIVGEGEYTLLQLIQSLKNNSSFQAIDGLRFIQNNQLIQTNKRENSKELDTIPFPAWDLVDMNEYKNRWIKSSGYFSLNMSTTRGCPFKCNWCAKPIYGNRYHSRSPENVVEEIKMLKEKYSVNYIWFCDDIFGLKPSWVNHFSDCIKRNELSFKFKIQSRVDLLLEEDNIEALARAGCDEIWVGAESGSQKILDAMDKGTKVEQIYKATNLMKVKGIKPCFFLQFGYLNETKDDIDKTINMVFELMPHDIGISVSYPLPGTKFYDTVKSQLNKKTNWTDSDELAMMFNATYPAVFYKKLQRYVHHEFRKRKAFEALKKFSDFKKSISLVYRIPQSIISKAAIKKYVA